MRVLVYISGPLTNGDTLGLRHREANVRVACSVQRDLFARGFAVICPHLMHYSQLMFPEMYETYMANDMTLIEKSDVVFRFQGDSHGADRECLHAIDKGIPVVRSFLELDVMFATEPV